jgi:hypothetical protein
MHAILKWSPPENTEKTRPLDVRECVLPLPRACDMASTFGNRGKRQKQRKRQRKRRKRRYLRGERVQLLQAKCAVKGKALVVCSEMYTSRTYGRCYRLRVRLGSSDVLTCPFCADRAGRDENAALHILRHEYAGSPQVFE